MDSDSEARRLSHEDDMLEEDSFMEQPQISRSLLDEDDDEAEDSNQLRPSSMLLNNANNSSITINNDIVMEEDDDTKEESSIALNEQNSPLSAGSSRSRNKRKNFKPRNIIYDQASEQQQFQAKKLHLMPQKLDNNGPMDLSVQGSGSNGDNIEDEDIDGSSDGPENDLGPGINPAGGLMPPMTSAAGLSVVRPEVLFGGQGPKDLIMPPGCLGPTPGMSPLLANILAASSAPGGPASVKDAMQEMLKLFGFPPELAEVFAKNAQAMQQQQQKDSLNLAAAAAASAAISGAPDLGKFSCLFI